MDSLFLLSKCLLVGSSSRDLQMPVVFRALGHFSTPALLIQGQRILRCESCFVHCRMLSSIWGFCLVETRHSPSDNQNSLQKLPKCALRGKITTD
jgi:hypothetical protein